MREKELLLALCILFFGCLGGGGYNLDVVVTDFNNDSGVIEKILKDNQIQISGIRQVSPSLENVFIHKIESDYS